MRHHDNEYDVGSAGDIRIDGVALRNFDQVILRRGEIAQNVHEVVQFVATVHRSRFSFCALKDASDCNLLYRFKRNSITTQCSNGRSVPEKIPSTE